MNTKSFQELVADAARLHAQEQEIKSRRLAVDRELSDIMRANGVKECSIAVGGEQHIMQRKGHMVRIKRVDSADQVESRMQSQSAQQAKASTPGAAEPQKPEKK